MSSDYIAPVDTRLQQIFDLTGPPHLIDVGDKRMYLRIVVELVGELDAFGTFDLIIAREIADRCYNIICYGRMKALIIHGARTPALIQMIFEALPYSDDPEREVEGRIAAKNLTKLTHDEAAEDADIVPEDLRLIDDLKSNGEPKVIAKAFEKQLAVICMIDRMIAAEERLRNALLRDYEFFRDAVERIDVRAREISNQESEEISLAPDGPENNDSNA